MPEIGRSVNIQVTNATSASSSYVEVASAMTVPAADLTPLSEYLIVNGEALCEASHTLERPTAVTGSPKTVPVKESYPCHEISPVARSTSRLSHPTSRPTMSLLNLQRYF